MCDYSLHAFTNRLAQEGEELVVHRFFGGSVGLASPAEVAPLNRPDRPRRLWSWQKVRAWFTAETGTEPQPCAVCIPPGATLVLRDVPIGLEREFGIAAGEEATFVQTTANPNTYRDALRFANQRQVLLQALRPGLRLEVVNLELKTDDMQDGLDLSLSSARSRPEMEIHSISR